MTDENEAPEPALDSDGNLRMVGIARVTETRWAWFQIPAGPPVGDFATEEAARADALAIGFQIDEDSSVDLRADGGLT